MAIPAYLVVLYAGWRRMIEVWPAVFVAGATFGVGQFLVSNFVGPELTDALSALISLTSVALLLRVWQPAEQFTEGARLAVAYTGDARHQPTHRPRLRELRDPDRHRADRPDRQLRRHVGAEAAGQRDGAAQVRPGRQQAVPGARGSVPSAAAEPQGFRFPVWEFNWPGAYAIRDGKVSPLVAREMPVVAASSPYPLTYRLDFLAAAGTLVIMASLIAFVPMLIFGVPFSALGVTFMKTVRQLRLPVITIAFILSIATVMNYSGHDLVDGAGAGEDGRAVSVLRGVARHDRRVPHRQRHLVEHACSARCRRRRRSCPASIRS